MRLEEISTSGVKSSSSLKDTSTCFELKEAVVIISSHRPKNWQKWKPVKHHFLVEIGKHNILWDIDSFYRSDFYERETSAHWMRPNDFRGADFFHRTRRPLEYRKYVRSAGIWSVPCSRSYIRAKLAWKISQCRGSPCEDPVRAPDRAPNHEQLHLWEEACGLRLSFSPFGKEKRCDFSADRFANLRRILLKCNEKIRQFFNSECRSGFVILQYRSDQILWICEKFWKKYGQHLTSFANNLFPSVKFKGIAL